MSCYLRHIKGILDEAGTAITSANRKQIDQALHQAVGVAYKNCPATWKTIKAGVMDNEEKRRTLIEQLKIALR